MFKGQCHKIQIFEDEIIPSGVRYTVGVGQKESNKKCYQNMNLVLLDNLKGKENENWLMKTYSAVINEETQTQQSCDTVPLTLQ